MAVPAGEGAAFEVVQSQAGLQLAVVVLDPPSDLGQACQFPDGGVLREGGQPVAAGSSASGGHSASSQQAGRLRSAARGMGLPAGRTRMARKQPVMAASGLSRVALVPCRQVTGRTWSACARARVRRLAGGRG